MTFMIGQLKYFLKNSSINLDLGTMCLNKEIVGHTVRTIVYPCD